MQYFSSLFTPIFVIVAILIQCPALAIESDKKKEKAEPERIVEAYYRNIDAVVKLKMCNPESPWNQCMADISSEYVNSCNSKILDVYKGCTSKYQAELLNQLGGDYESDMNMYSMQVRNTVNCLFDGISAKHENYKQNMSICLADKIKQVKKRKEEEAKAKIEENLLADSHCRLVDDMKTLEKVISQNSDERSEQYYFVFSDWALGSRQSYNDVVLDSRYEKLNKGQCYRLDVTREPNEMLERLNLIGPPALVVMLNGKIVNTIVGTGYAKGFYTQKLNQ